MNSELAEEYGAGFEGTKALLYKYLKDTPGQKIIKYMDKNESTFKMFKIKINLYKKFIDTFIIIYIIREFKKA